MVLQIPENQRTLSQKIAVRGYEKGLYKDIQEYKAPSLSKNNNRIYKNLMSTPKRKTKKSIIPEPVVTYNTDDSNDSKSDKIRAEIFRRDLTLDQIAQKYSVSRDLLLELQSNDD